ncbi:DUF1801 domain-containing protein [Neolewinella antarctica]|uniref:YdhG-like domain-containing protein n=1 Tax=Neolewinella antarctica TaxID=442734 RepID=A0ABX0XAS1_9BACT|nr:DUF1801 domain-containing protein [Neolewinella antarctica]NJC26165.1 hypothetical protein [Neolewinella antarctica]
MSYPVITTDPLFTKKLAEYPPLPQQRLARLRALVREVTTEAPEIDRLEETLKWGEPSFLTRGGSTLRMDWKEKAPDSYALYFKCTSKLIPTIREIYGDQFSYAANRAIVLPLTAEPPVAEIKNCIRLALRYHRLKHLPLLGETP